MSTFIRKPCKKRTCKNYHKVKIDTEIDLNKQALLEVFGTPYHRVCLACVHFTKYDLYNKKE